MAALYSDHAVSLIRLAYLMLGDRPAAEDAVQERPKGSIEGSRVLLAKASVATGKVTAGVRNPGPADGYQQVMYTSAAGRALVARPPGVAPLQWPA